MTQPTGATRTLEPSDEPDEPQASQTPNRTRSWRPKLRTKQPKERTPSDSTSRLSLGRWLPPFVYLLAAYAAWRWLPTSDTIRLFVVVVLLALAVWTALQFRLDSTRERPVPEQGAPLHLRRLARLLMLQYVPKRSPAELLKLAGERCFNLLQRRSVIIGVYGPKGGVGKTTVATIIAYLISLFSKKPVLIIDAREKRGNITEAMGFWRRDAESMAQPSTTTTLTFRQALDLNDWGLFENATDMFDIIPSVTGMMLHVIASDHIEDDAEWPIEIERVERFFRQARRHFKAIVYETTDDVHSPLNRALLRVCDIPVFVHRVNMPNSLAETKQGFSIYRRDFGEKIRKRGVLFVLAAKRGQTAQEWSDKFKNAVPPERTTLIPRSGFYESDNTDPGFEEDELRDVTRLPSTTRPLDRTPPRIAALYLDGINPAIESVPVTDWTDRLPVSATAESSDFAESASQAPPSSELVHVPTKTA